MFINELDEISDDEKAILNDSIGHLVKGGPSAEPAKIRFKKFISKIGSESSEIIQSILTDVLSETIRKSLYE